MRCPANCNIPGCVTQSLEFELDLTQFQKLAHEMRIVQAFVSSTLAISIVNVGSQHNQSLGASMVYLFKKF